MTTGTIGNRYREILEDGPKVQPNAVKGVLCYAVPKRVHECACGAIEESTSANWKRCKTCRGKR